MTSNNVKHFFAICGGLSLFYLMSPENSSVNKWKIVNEPPSLESVVNLFASKSSKFSQSTSRKSTEALFTSKNEESPLCRSQDKKEERLCQRASHIKQMCAKNPQARVHTLKQIPTYLTNEKHSILYCPVPKSGWSSWKHMFFEEWGPGNATEVTERGRKGWDSPWFKAHLAVRYLSEAKHLSSYRNKLIFIRNPYDRLVSGYKDRILRLSKGDPPTFSQFLKQTIINPARLYSHNQLDRFTAGQKLDIHFRPQTLLCNVCLVNFNIVGVFSHMHEDMAGALVMLNMTKTHPVQKNPTSSDKQLSYWYKNVSERQIADIQLIYKHDFELLGFSKELPF